MACQNHKDLSLCLSRTRVQVLDTKFFFGAYLWETRDAMRANMVVMSDDIESWAVVPDAEAHTRGTRAFTAFMPYKLRGRYRDYLPKLGEMHFYRGDGWGLEVVAHECTHAACCAALAMHANPKRILNGDETSPCFVRHPPLHALELGVVAHVTDQEVFCYIHSTLVMDVYKWLLQADPPTTEKRKE